MYILIFLVGIGVGSGVVRAIMSKRIGELQTEARRIEKEKHESEEIASGFEEYNDRIQGRIDERKAEIIDALQKQQSIQRRDVTELLDVSSKTAFNYLEELEQEGMIEQVGETGRSVLYKLVETAR